MGINGKLLWIWNLVVRQQGGGLGSMNPNLRCLLYVCAVLINSYFRHWHWIIISVKPAYYIKLFWSMWCPEISLSRSLCMGPVLSVICGSHLDCSVGQMSQKVWLTFNPLFQGKISQYYNQLTMESAISS